jgi:hypothetical protein
MQEEPKGPDQNSASDETPAPDQKALALSPAKLAEKRRLAEALRANLRRRKAQTRQRRDDSGPQEA